MEKKSSTKANLSLSDHYVLLEGEWLFWPTEKATPMSAVKLRKIADKLDKKNEKV